MSLIQKGRREIGLLLANVSASSKGFLFSGLITAPLKDCHACDAKGRAMVSKRDVLIDGKLFLVVGMGPKRQGVGLDEDIYIHILWTVTCSGQSRQLSPPADDYDQMEEDLEDQVVRVCREQLAEAPIRTVFHPHLWQSFCYIVSGPWSTLPLLQPRPGAAAMRFNGVLVGGKIQENDRRRVRDRQTEIFLLITARVDRTHHLVHFN